MILVVHGRALGNALCRIAATTFSCSFVNKSLGISLDK
jgi:hypothetical protein